MLWDKYVYDNDIITHICIGNTALSNKGKHESNSLYASDIFLWMTIHLSVLLRYCMWTAVNSKETAGVYCVLCEIFGFEIGFVVTLF